MNTFTKSIFRWKTIVVAGTMLLLTLAAVAQQEVDPDHFDGTSARVVQKAAPKAKVHKQLAASQKPKKASSTAKAKHVPARKNSSAGDAVASIT